MSDKAPNRLLQSVKGHLRTAVVAVIFGLTAYGLIHILIWAVRVIENF